MWYFRASWKQARPGIIVFGFPTRGRGVVGHRDRPAKFTVVERWRVVAAFKSTNARRFQVFGGDRAQDIRKDEKF